LQAAAPHRLGELLGAADHGARAAEEEAHESRSAPGEREIGEASGRAGAVERDDEGTAAEECDRGAGQPVRVDEIRAACRRAAGGDHRDEAQKRKPWTTLEGGGGAAAAGPGEPEGPGGAGRARRDRGR